MVVCGEPQVLVNNAPQQVLGAHNNHYRTHRLIATRSLTFLASALAGTAPPAWSREWKLKNGPFRLVYNLKGCPANSRSSFVWNGGAASVCVVYQNAQSAL
jgi:hypothetical protein